MTAKISTLKFSSLCASLILAISAIPNEALATSENIHLGMTRNAAGEPVVVYIFSDGDQTQYAPIDAMSIELDETDTCLADFDADWNAIAVGPGEAIYGPGSERRFGENKDQKTIAFERLPSYFAREAVALMLEQGVVENEEAAVPYFNCAGRVWASVLSQTETPE